MLKLLKLSRREQPLVEVEPTLKEKKIGEKFCRGKWEIQTPALSFM